MIFLFWFFAFLLVYPLIFYPLCLKFWHMMRRHKAMPFSKTQCPPHVSILLSVYNEQKVIDEKIKNFLALDYAPERLELLIISDQCTDNTENIVQQYTSDTRIRLLRQETRGGKTKALNRAAQEARGDILFFTDADSMLHPKAMQKLTAPFSQPHVGLVSGRSVYMDNMGKESTGSLYRRYEEWIKNYEGNLFGIAGADGAIYALRKELYQELPPNIINDLAHPIQVILADHHAMTQADAIVYEPAEEQGSVFARQTRIMAQSWYVFFCYAKALWQAKHWGFLWQFISHKVLRWLALIWLMAFGVVSMVLLQSESMPSPLLPCLGILGLAGLLFSALLGEKARVFGRISRLFLLQSTAGVYGLVRLCQGEAFVTWSPKGK